MTSDMLIKQYCKELRIGMNIYNSYSKIIATDHADFLAQLVNAAALCPAVDVVNCPYIDGIGVHM